MTKDEIKEYSVRISQSSRTEMVVITFEIMVNYIESGQKALGEGNIEDFRFNIKKARHFLMDLSSSLDMKYKISGDLMSIYMFINKWLISSESKKTLNDVERIKDIIKNLMNSFRTVSENVNDNKSMNRSDEIHTGITYGRNSQLNEYVVRK